jgi:hypothetical protein
MNMTLKEGMSGQVEQNGVDYQWWCLAHLIQESSFPPFSEFDTHVLTIKVRISDTTKGKKIAKRAIQEIFDRPRVMKLSGHYRLAAVYVLVTLNATQN